MVSDAELDRIIATAGPNLRTALQSVLSGNAVHLFNIADGTNSQTGVKTNFVCFIVQEYTAMILATTIQGIAASSEKAMADMMQARQTQPKIIRPS
jgi:hypothetical protein